MPAEEEEMMNTETIPFKDLKQGEFFVAPDEEGTNRMYQLRQRGVGVLHLLDDVTVFKDGLALSRTGRREFRDSDRVVRFSLDDPD